jgi:hypothetical protein
MSWTKILGGLIVFDEVLVSDGATVGDWKSRLCLSPDAEEVLSSPQFKPTTGIQYRLGILPGNVIPDEFRTINAVNAIIQMSIFSGWRLHTPHSELACLAREKVLTNQCIRDMGFSTIVFMHDAVTIPSSSYMRLINVCRNTSDRMIFTCCGDPSIYLRSNFGLAFVVSRVNS